MDSSRIAPQLLHWKFKSVSTLCVQFFFFFFSHRNKYNMPWSRISPQGWLFATVHILLQFSFISGCELFHHACLASDAPTSLGSLACNLFVYSSMPCRRLATSSSFARICTTGSKISRDARAAQIRSNSIAAPSDIGRLLSRLCSACARLFMLAAMSFYSSAADQQTTCSIPR